PASKTIFISRYLEEDSLLKTKMEAFGHKVTDQSLLHFSQIRFSHSPPSDWIFFSSKNAIKYFFAQNPVILRKTRFAVFGKGSARYLRNFDKTADFIGQGNNPVAIAKQFALLIQNETILFPMAIDSIQTVQRQLGYNNVVKNLYVYKTELKKEFSVPEADILVFTSPSNVEAYFSKYKIEATQNVIAIGTTTRQKLLSFGVKQVALPESFEEESLLQCIWRVIEGNKLVKSKDFF
ncbi:MAG: uroporphyrinogen-III synthase, partial [Bacteroidia bacterium]|nr:uroporphyrinogen-III synthase [Bacteroidia bacterium]